MSVIKQKALLVENGSVNRSHADAQEHGRPDYNSIEIHIHCFLRDKVRYKQREISAPRIKQARCPATASARLYISGNNYPIKTSSTIISAKPKAKPMVPRLE